MNQYRSCLARSCGIVVFLAFGNLILKAKSPWKVDIQLYSGKLVELPIRVLEANINFRSIECAIPFINLPRSIRAIQRLPQLPLSAIPQVKTANKIFLRSRRKLKLILAKIEGSHNHICKRQC